MQSTLERLRALERRYTGPVPKALLDTTLYDTSPTLRIARDRAGFYHRWSGQTIEASTRWRAAVAHGDFRRLTAMQILARRLVLARTMLQAARQCLQWNAYLAALERRYGSREAPD